MSDVKERKSYNTLPDKQKYLFWEALKANAPRYREDGVGLKEAAEDLSEKLGFLVTPGNILGAVKAEFVERFWPEDAGPFHRTMTQVARHDRQIAELNVVVAAVLSSLGVTKEELLKRGPG